MSEQNQSFVELLRALGGFTIDHLKNLITQVELNQIACSYNSEEKQDATLHQLLTERFSSVAPSIKNKGAALVANASSVIQSLESELDQIKRQLVATPAYEGSDRDKPWFKIAIGMIIFLIIISISWSSYYTVLGELYPDKPFWMIFLPICLPTVLAFAAHFFVSSWLSHKVEIWLIYISALIFIASLLGLGVVSPSAMLSNPIQEAMAALDDSSGTSKWSTTDLLILKSILLFLIEGSISLLAVAYIRNKFSSRSRPNKIYAELRQRHDEVVNFLQKFVTLVQEITGLIADNALKALQDSELTSYRVKLQLARHIQHQVQ